VEGAEGGLAAVGLGRGAASDDALCSYTSRSRARLTSCGRDIARGAGPGARVRRPGAARETVRHGWDERGSRCRATVSFDNFAMRALQARAAQTRCLQKRRRHALVSSSSSSRRPRLATRHRAPPLPRRRARGRRSRRAPHTSLAASPPRPPRPPRADRSVRRARKRKQQCRPTGTTGSSSSWRACAR
jgi:hypothetical protein